MDGHNWNESFRIGIDDVDSQHQALLKCLNECMHEAAFAEGLADVVEMYILLHELNTHADHHFESEERLMQKVNYPELGVHQQQHRLFEEQVGQLVRAVNSGEAPVVAYLTTFLRDWYIRHILEDDKRIGVYMHSQK